MTAAFCCPKCGQSYALTPNVAGKAVQCLRCSTLFQVPALAQPVMGLPAGPQAATAAPAAAQPAAVQPVLQAAVNPAAQPQAVPTRPAPATPLGSSGQYYPSSMTDADRVLLGVGGALTAFALLGALLLAPALGEARMGMLVMAPVLGIGGAVLIAVALRRRLPIACLAAAGVLVLVLFSALGGARLGAERPSQRTALQDDAAIAVPSDATGTSPNSAGSVPLPFRPPGASLVDKSRRTGEAEEGQALKPRPSLESPLPEPKKQEDIQPTQNRKDPWARPLYGENPPATSSLPQAAGATEAARPSATSPTSPDSAAASPSSSSGMTPSASSPVISEALKSTLLIEHPLASGSGFVVGKNLVATNAHVVNGAYPDEITVRFGDENNVPRRVSRVLYFDRSRDLCLMEAEVDLKSLPVRGDYVLQPGDPVVLMGNPSVRGGILLRNVTNQGKMRTLVHIDGQDLYHVDANVNPGWSGGPIVDLNGNVVAVVVMKANDDVVKDLRSAMKKLDENFRSSEGAAAEGGITYGIPGSALRRILQEESLKHPQRQGGIQEKYVAQTLVGRMRVLGLLAILRMRINVPMQVRVEANAFAKGQFVGRSRMSTVKVEYVPLLSEEVAAAFQMMLRSPEVREAEDHFRKDFDSRLSTVLDSATAADEVKRDLKALKGKIRDATSYAENPGNTYVAYSMKVSGYSRDIRQLIDRLEMKVDARER